MDEKNKRGDLFTSKSKDFLEIFSKGRKFFEDVVKENERLRLRLAYFETQPQGQPNEEHERLVEKLTQKNRTLEERLQKLENMYLQIEEENKDFAAKYLEIEEQNNNLANLYVASYQLHSTLDFHEVIQIVMEIVINLIGAEEFVIFLMNEKEGILSPVASEGVEIDSVPSFQKGQGIIGMVAENTENYYREDLVAAGSLENPLAVISLKIQDRVIGVICVFRLFSQKNGFSSVDHELFTLLAGHAATAIFSAQLFNQSERKLSTLKNFLELLKTEKNP